MKPYQKAIAWAAATVLAALAGRAGAISPDMANTLVIVLPILAVTTMGQRCCPPVQGA